MAARRIRGFNEALKFYSSFVPFDKFGPTECYANHRRTAWGVQGGRRRLQVAHLMGRPPLKRP
jgi:hypothetical protein